MSTANTGSTQELTVSECLALVRAVPVGRLAVLVDGAPDIFPLNHVVDHGTVVVRTAAGTKLSAAAGRQVAFEADGLDHAAGEAWSVVIKGTATRVDQLHDVIDALALPLTPWQEGDKPFFLRIEPGTVTGRRLRFAPPPDERAEG